MYLCTTTKDNREKNKIGVAISYAGSCALCCFFRVGFFSFLSLLVAPVGLMVKSFVTSLPARRWNEQRSLSQRGKSGCSYPIDPHHLRQIKSVHPYSLISADVITNSFVGDISHKAPSTSTTSRDGSGLIVVLLLLVASRSSSRFMMSLSVHAR